MFRGLNKISLDTKGRISIPTKYRSELAKYGSSKLICTIDIDQWQAAILPNGDIVKSIEHSQEYFNV